MAAENPITYYRELKHAMSSDEFAEDFPYPFLLRRRTSQTLVHQQMPVASDWSDELEYNTDVIDVDQIPRRSVGRITGAKIVPIVKSDRNPFSGQISVGRAKNCDIILRDASVSKHHAYFRVIDAATAELVDMGSQNKTTINAEPIKSNTPVTVVSGDNIAFGSVIGVFVDATRLYQLL
jgi:hypothetical protein